MGTRTERRPETLGARVTEAREAIGITQIELAHRAGTSQAVIHKIETNQSSHPRIIEEIAGALRECPGWLMYGGLKKEVLEVAAYLSTLDENGRARAAKLIHGG